MAAGFPVGKLSARCLVIACYSIPAVAMWMLLGAGLMALPLAGIALAAIAIYGAYYGLTELSGSRGLAAPGRRWQVPESMMIGAPRTRRLLVWGAILGPGFATRNPYAGFGLLPLAVAAMRLSGTGAGLVLAATIGLAHASARAVALLRDVSAAQATTAAGQLELLIKTVYWRRLDGAILLAAAVAATVLAVRYF
ncbi:MAG TPA: hypothetical protein VFQ44_14290 [Streptosporangiaceae bacterium]|nr:hypothetical protein [Streptosporangiaceae bacterium]